jgi:hypothetical protein
MSATRWWVVLAARAARSLPAWGRLRPQPRWSKRMTRCSARSKRCAHHGPHPEPGPPCSTTAGLPVGAPHSCQWIRCPSPTSSRPWAWGSSTAVEGTGRIYRAECSTSSSRYMYRLAGPCMQGPETGRTCAAGTAPHVARSSKWTAVALPDPRRGELRPSQAKWSSSKAAAVEDRPRSATSAGRL